MRALGCLTAAVATAASIVALAPAATAVPFPGGQATTVFIPGADGVPLNAVVLAPPDLRAHRNALVLQPSGWGMPAMGSLGSAVKLATGNDVVSIEYTARGMYLSQGEVDLFGAKDAADASAIIDWAVATLNVDPQRVGVAGGSYGAGMALIAAAHDARIKAIVADSPPGDLAFSIAPNDTVKSASPEVLAAAGVSTNRFGVPLTELGLKLIASNDPSSVKALPQNKIADYALPGLNANNTAVFLSHDWQDSLLPPGPSMDIFDRLTGPKMLLMQPGDHSTGGGAGQVGGLPNPVWDRAERWLDHYLNGADNGIDREPTVLYKPANGGDYRPFESVAAATEPIRSYPLSPPVAGTLGADPGAPWVQPLVSGPTIAVSVVPYITGTAAQLGVAPTFPLDGIDRNAAAVWRSAPFEGGTRLAGKPRPNLTVIPSTPDLTMIGILYDEDQGGGKVISQFPVTRHGLRPGEPTAIAWELGPTDWNVAAGHRLTLVVTTQDPVAYVSATPLGSIVTFAAPSSVDLPVAAP